MKFLARRFLSLATFAFMALASLEAAQPPGNPKITRRMQSFVDMLMIQRAGFPNSDNSPVRKAFQETAAAIAR